jgi:hypothetical protein
VISVEISKYISIAAFLLLKITFHSPLSCETPKYSKVENVRLFTKK